MSQINYAGLLTRLKEKRAIEIAVAKRGYICADEKKKLVTLNKWLDEFLKQHQASTQLKL